MNSPGSWVARAAAQRSSAASSLDALKCAIRTAHTPFCTLVSARQRACSERPAASLACLSSRTAHTVANTQRSGPHAKLFHTDGAAALARRNRGSQHQVVRRRHGIGGGCSHRQRVTANLPVALAGAAAAPRRRASATLTAYVSMDEDLRKIEFKEIPYRERVGIRTVKALTVQAYTSEYTLVASAEYLH